MNKEVDVMITAKIKAKVSVDYDCEDNFMEELDNSIDDGLVIDSDTTYLTISNIEEVKGEMF